jgi:G3E family GTPase
MPYALIIFTATLWKQMFLYYYPAWTKRWAIVSFGYFMVEYLKENSVRLTKKVLLAQNSKEIQMNKEAPVPVYILSGFLGSGKTTFLTKAIDYFTGVGRKPAVMMNEIGEVNLDGLMIDTTVPMAEMLSGCICCTIREDVGATLHDLIAEHRPDLIFIESTGIAKPIEIVDEVTDSSLLQSVELKSVITVVDAPQLLQLSRTSVGKTLQLMREQIRCAGVLIVNKTDLVSSADLQEVEQLVRDWNPYAHLELTVHSQVNMEVLLMDGGTRASGQHEQWKSQAEQHDDHTHHNHDGHAHPSHDHVIAYTHYFDKPIDSKDFEHMMSKLPPEVYRAKGILSFSDTGSRFMFQYAYGELDFVKIRPQGVVSDVAVFIGENFSKDEIRATLATL